MIITIKPKISRENREAILEIPRNPPDPMFNARLVAMFKWPPRSEHGMRNMKFELDGLTGSL